MADSRTWPPAELLTYINKLRQLILRDKQLYGQFKVDLKAYPELWGVVGRLLKARARYYRGEIVRAKQDTKRYALGEDPREPTKHGEMICSWGDRYLEDLPEQLKSLEQHWAESSGAHGRNNRTIIATQLWEGDELLVGITKNSMQTVIKDLERITYG